MKYVKPTTYLTRKEKDITEFIKDNIVIKYIPESNNVQTVRLMDYPADGDDLVLAIVLFKQKNIELEHAKNLVKNLSMRQKVDFFKKVFLNMNPWDRVLREFEFIYFTFELIVSASNYGQLKRHRMANIIAEDYDISLGVMVPESIIETKQKDLFLQMVEKTELFYNKLQKRNPLVSPYVLL